MEASNLTPTPTRTPTPSGLQPRDGNATPTVIDAGLALINAGRATLQKDGTRPEANEDASICEPREGLFAVFDGMGGHAAGHVAARLAKETARRYLLRPPKDVRHSPESMLRFLGEVVVRAHTRIVRAAQRPDWRGMGTTCSLGYVFRDPTTRLPHELLTAHVGDSRIARYRDGVRERCTTDHSGIQLVIAARQLPERADEFGDPDVDARIDAMGPTLRALIPRTRNQITRHLGQRDAKGTAVALSVDLDRIPLAAGDTFVFTTDGIHDNLLDAEAAVIALAHARDPAAHATALVDAARARSETDHVRAKHDDMTTVVAIILTAQR